MFDTLRPNSLNNCRRVPYEEVRLPPSCNQRCDLYVDDEVEVRVKFCLLRKVAHDASLFGWIAAM